MRCALLFVVLAASCVAADPAAEAYAAVRAADWDTAVARFREALRTAPDRASLHKDLAYALLRTGDTAAARDAFSAALRVDSEDSHLALEYAYLCHETGLTAEARRVFAGLLARGVAQAAAPFEAIDRPLREGIERWKQAVAAAPGNWSNHEELARLAETRGELSLAAEQFETAWRMRPAKRSLLVDLGRVRLAQGSGADAITPLLAASRGAEPHAAERARALLPPRYPFVYEFRSALELDPANHELRRELAYLLLEMKNTAAAEAEFAELNRAAPGDRLSAAQLGFLRLRRGETQAAAPLLEGVLASGDDELSDRVRTALRMPLTLRRRDAPRARVSVEARTLAERSLAAGYLKDALKYLQIAHENDPLDFALLLKLGWTSNQTGDDAAAVRWFRLAEQSPDAKVSSEAARAGRVLGRGLALTRTSAWVLPFYSSRWRDLFSYGQVRLELRKTGVPLRPYVSARFIGDTRGAIEATQAMGPQYLSERSVIGALGVTTNSWRGAVAWAEAGWAMPYVRRAGSSARMLPDYRGGVALARGFGRSMAAKTNGPFFEVNADAVFVSRFGNDTLFYVQNRAGYTLPALAGSRLQLFWNGNATADAKRQGWANIVEHGPGARFRFAWMPPALSFTASALRGQYTVRRDNPQPPHFRDIRVGFWYAFTY